MYSFLGFMTVGYWQIINICYEIQPKLFSNPMLLTYAVSDILFKDNIQKTSMIHNWTIDPRFNDNVERQSHFGCYARSPVGEEHPILSRLRPSDGHFGEPDTGESAT